MLYVVLMAHKYILKIYLETRKEDCFNLQEIIENIYWSKHSFLFQLLYELINENLHKFISGVQVEDLIFGSSTLFLKNFKFKLSKKKFYVKFVLFLFVRLCHKYN